MSEQVPGPVCLYLHGFASSVGSTKARAFQTWAAERAIPLRALDLRVPSFEGLLFSEIERTVERAIDDAGGPHARVVLIGSSLGGLSALRAAERDPRVAAVVALAPALQLATRWEERLGPAAWNAWREQGALEVDDHMPGPDGSKRRGHVHFRFVEELARIDVERGTWPDVRVPVLIVHGRQDDVVAIDLSRTWASDRRHVRLVEVEDGHELARSVPFVLEQSSDFLRGFFPV